MLEKEVAKSGILGPDGMPLSSKKEKPIHVTEDIDFAPCNRRVTPLRPNRLQGVLMCMMRKKEIRLKYVLKQVC